MKSDRGHPAVRKAVAVIKEAAESNLTDSEVILFGSRASGSATRRSDFDLAVRRGKNDGLGAVADFRETLESSPDLIFSVDVVDWDAASPDFRSLIEKGGILWKKSSPHSRH